jgi:hypothetical protein
LPWGIDNFHFVYNIYYKHSAFFGFVK